MTSSLRIAHVSDLHLLEFEGAGRSWSEQVRLRYLSLLRALDPKERVRRLRHALERARRAGFDHLFITGDLTEDGRASQFEVLAEELDEMRIKAGSVTMVPGNHDLYDAPSAWTDALLGPLAAFAAQSSRPFQLDHTLVVPVVTARHQHFLLSHGELAGLDTLRRHFSDAARSGRPLLVVQHHPPIPSWFTPYQWADGLWNSHHLLECLREHPAPAVLHGHLHRWTDGRARPPRTVRSFGAPAVCASDEPRVRFYDLRPDGVCALHHS